MTNNERPPLGDLTVGQEVIVARSPNESWGRKPEDWYIQARVVKVNRVWIELEKAQDEGLPTRSVNRWRMRRDTQNEGSDYSGSNARFLTNEQHAWEESRTTSVLRENGIELSYTSLWRGREAELADLISTATSKEVGVDE